MWAAVLIVWLPGVVSAEPFRISGPPVAESLRFAVMAEKGLAPGNRKMVFIPWHSPDQARALVAGKRVDAMIISTSGAAAFAGKGIKTRIAGLFNVPAWVVSVKDAARPGPLQGVLLFPFGHREMPELIFDLVYGRTRGLDTRHTGGSLEAVNLMGAGRADHALLAEPAATMAVARQNNSAVPLIKHRDIRRDWAEKFEGRPLYVSAFAVFGRAADRKEDIRAAMAGYTAAGQWIKTDPDAALALARDKVPVLADQISGDDGVQTGAELVADHDAFDDAIFFMEKLHGLYPAAVGGGLPDRSLFLELP